VSSPSYSMGKRKTHAFSLTLTKRVLLVLLACCIQMIYIPTSNRVAGGIEPKLAIDVFPLWPIWVLPYVLCYVFWLSSIVWLIFKVEDRYFRCFIAASILTFSIGNIIFIFFPTYVPMTPLDGNDFFTSLLRVIHGHWGRYDAFPSGHVYITALLSLFFIRWYPRQKILWVLILVLVSFSTLFTGQHYVLDVLGGFAVAFTGYQFGLWWSGFLPSQKRPRKRIAPSSLH
jgi:membrane-associated phospholipid phosphatase